MFGFISGAVNNDNGVNLACAAIIYLTVRALRRGLPAWGWAALGATMARGAADEGHGLRAVPAGSAGAASFVLARRHGRRDLLGLAARARRVPRRAGRLGTTRPGLRPHALHDPRRRHARRELPGARHADGLPVVAVADPDPVQACRSSPTSRSSSWPFFNIYIERGFGSFGWYAIEFPLWVYLPIAGAFAALVALGARALWERRAAPPRLAARGRLPAARPGRRGLRRRGGVLHADRPADRRHARAGALCVPGDHRRGRPGGRRMPGPGPPPRAPRGRRARGGALRHDRRWPPLTLSTFFS